MLTILAVVPPGGSGGKLWKVVQNRSDQLTNLICIGLDEVFVMVLVVLNR